jgi:hypothetical protein
MNGESEDANKIHFEAGFTFGATPIHKAAHCLYPAVIFAYAPSSVSACVFKVEPKLEAGASGAGDAGGPEYACNFGFPRSSS